MRPLLGALLLAGTLAARFTAPPGDTATAIVSPAWLSRHLHDRGIVVVQNGDPDQYARSHIPGSVLLGNGALEQSDSGPDAPERPMDMSALPSPSELRARIERLGVSDSTRVIVVFTGQELPPATRVMFLLTYAGLTHVSLLDGGLDDWRRGGFPMSAAPTTPGPGHVSATPVTTAIADYRYVQEHRHAPHVKLIDARAPVYFDGPVERGSMAMRPGHIPGARNIPYSSLFDGALQFHTRQDVERLFRDAGVAPGDTVIAYCHVGIQATVVVLAARLAEQPVRLYPGSFHDWSRRNLPTEGGSK